jgi:hypothetical protein
MHLSSQEIKIKRFDPSKISDTSLICCIGKRKSGKSTAIKDIMWYKQDIPIGQIISGSENANPFFEHFFPSTYIDDEYTPDTIDNILKRQIKIKKFASQQEQNNKKEVDSRFLLVFDDCLHDSKWQKTKQMKSVFMNGRHFGIFFILCLQYVLGIPPILRTNIDYIFIFRESSIQNRKKLYDNYGASIPTFQLFCLLMDNLDKYECLVICNDADKVTLQEQVMYFKANLRANYKFGSKAFWEQHKRLKHWKQQVYKYQHDDVLRNLRSNKSTKMKIIKEKKK